MAREAFPVRFNSKTETGLRAILVVAGGSLIVFSLLADKVGLGPSGSFGSGQVLLALLGALFLLAGLLWGKFPDFYRGGAIVLLNTALLIGLLELMSIGVSRLGIIPTYRETIFSSYLELPYYVGQEWAITYWAEARAAENYHYRPYTGWRHDPFNGETINISQESIRGTHGAVCTADAIDVYTFGGSSMWGWGSPDWGTIASYLQQGLDAQLDRPVCVTNFGEDGYVSTQEVIKLIRELQDGDVPDVVVFYDGVNEVFAAYETGLPGVHTDLSEISASYENQEHPLVSWIKSSRLYSLVEGMAGNPALEVERPNPRTRISNPDERALAASVVEVYRNNYRIVQTLASEYDFEVYFFWQPHLALDRKPLSPEEEIMKARMDPSLASFAGEVYRQVEIERRNHERLLSITDAFEGFGEQVWIDEWGHITPEGNRLIAQAMLASIEVGDWTHK